LNRELTWLAFDLRVLREAEDERVPLLERLKFLAIACSNLDKFFMKRIGGLKQQLAAGVQERTLDGRTPEQQILECNEMVRGFLVRTMAAHEKLRLALREHGVVIARHDELGEADRSALREHYLRNVFPLVTPQAMDPTHPFPFVSNLSLNLLVTVRHPRDGIPSLARVKVPLGEGVPRMLRVGTTGHVYVPLEEVMASNLDLLFPGMEIETCELFRVTRNANLERTDDQADDLLELIEAELRERRFAPIVRLVVAPGMAPEHRGMLAAEFGLDPELDVFEVEGMLGVGDLMPLAGLDLPELRDPPHHPVTHPELTSDRNVFHVIRDRGPLLLEHPYESFARSVELLLREASTDPKVRAIKMTLYRTSEDTRVLEHLIEAAQNGKQVAVVVELKARFDEAANIRWANRLEEAGIHVTYGVVGVKTHCKVVLVVRQDYDGLRRYAHIGTGNYHAGTARIYSDLGLLTCDEAIGEDLTELFNYLTTGYRPRRGYKKLLPAPSVLKRALLDRIDREVRHHEAGEASRIQMKMNALEDGDVTRALYRATRAGVPVDLIVRDTCRLRPGLPGISESATVVSIVGRFLEHARIYAFANAGNPEILIGSADCMNRNLESRIEVVAPVEDPALQKELQFFLDCQLADQRSAWEMQPDGSYVQRQPEEGRSRSCQEQLIERAEKRHRKATRLRRRKPSGPYRRNGPR
ncbi:MAG: polyphosphate kinase 1, partial [Myxococcales bacterium]|nr:polyphosphate kinase 1 [Myxococcales bacterium]